MGIVRAVKTAVIQGAYGRKLGGEWGEDVIMQHAACRVQRVHAAEGVGQQVDLDINVFSVWQYGRSCGSMLITGYWLLYRRCALQTELSYWKGFLGGVGN